MNIYMNVHIWTFIIHKQLYNNFKDIYINIYSSIHMTIKINFTYILWLFILTVGIMEMPRLEVAALIWETIVFSCPNKNKRINIFFYSCLTSSSAHLVYLDAPIGWAH